MRVRNYLNNLNAVNSIVQNSDVITDMVNTLCGQHIGDGLYRSVYEYQLDRNYVIKLEGTSTNCNLVEYLIWEEVQGLIGDMAWVKDWFAPVKWISPNGRILVMKKTKKTDKPKPDKIPKFLWDVKENNFGWIGDKYVCHDYGQFYNMIHYPKGMQKVNW
jgi:hypothetical protein